MIIREVFEKEKKSFNTVVTHPLQSWEWGEFRQQTGIDVVRLGLFEGTKIKEGYQITIHPLPKTRFSVGYFPKGPMPHKPMLDALKKLGKDKNCLLIKLEPNVGTPFSEKNNSPNTQAAFSKIHQFLLENGCRQGRPLFAQFTFEIDLTKPEEELLKQMKPKTRYNTNLAQKKGVEVTEAISLEDFETFYNLSLQTAERQRFFIHPKSYYQKIWEILGAEKVAKILIASYQGEPLAAWMFFIYDGVIYYPYGGSSEEHQNLHASNLLGWEGILLGKANNCREFDMWGANADLEDKTDPYFGFTNFKVKFGARHVQYIPSYDLVLNPALYKAFNTANKLRWQVLNFIKRLK